MVAFAVGVRDFNRSVVTKKEINMLNYYYIQTYMGISPVS